MFLPQQKSAGAGYWAASKMDDLERLAPSMQTQMRRLMNAGYSARRIANLMDLPWIVVDRIKSRGQW